MDRELEQRAIRWELAGLPGSLSLHHPTKGSDVGNGSPPTHWHRRKQGPDTALGINTAPEIPFLMQSQCFFPAVFTLGNRQGQQCLLKEPVAALA